MGVRADNAVAGAYNALLRQQGVLDAHAAHVKEIGDVVFAGKVPGLAALLRSLNVLIGDKVVQHQCDAVLIKNRTGPALLKFVDGYRAGNIVAQHHIQLGFDELPGLYLFQPGMNGEDFLRHCHSHGNPPSLQIRIALLYGKGKNKNVKYDTFLFYFL